MKMFKKNLVATVVVAFFVFGILGLVRPNTALAASSPTLGTANSFSILAHTTVTNVPTSAIGGDVGLDNGVGGSSYDAGLTSAQVTGTIYATDAGGPDGALGWNAGLMTTARADNLTAFGILDQDCTTTYPAGAKDLVGLTLVPGVYCADAFTLSGTLNLSGSGVWIFKSAATLITSGTANVVGGDPCNVWWRVVSSATLGTNTSLIGNILASTSISMATGASLNGRALAYTGAVTLAGNTISGPVCAVAPTSSGSRTGTINVVKHVINDNGRTKIDTDFPLFVNGAPVVSGVTNSFPAPAAAYTVTETVDPNYIQTFSGDCDTSGRVGLSPGDNKICIITNDDIGAPVVVPPVPPLIDVVKVPNPLSLPNGPGLVNYTYTLRNIGTVPVTNITMVGDTCSPIALTSGDTNADSKLDLTETWVYNCSTTLTETHTNIVTAKGWANGISATDIASATVVVGLPIDPPLIHITKIPNPLTLGSGGGMVTYTKRVTNPGTVPLSNITVTDDKCSPITYISGDTNNDSKLDTTETWTYTCRTNLIRTTVNTATATGTANGLTAIDFAIATVIVAAPGLPSTGLPPAPWNIVIIIETLILILILLVITLKKRKA